MYNTKGGENEQFVLEVISMKLNVGQQAPNFTLKSHLGREYTLSEFRGKNVVIAFFPLAWTPI